MITCPLPTWYAESRRSFEEYLGQGGSPLTQPLLSLQKRSVSHMVAMKYSALFDDMGCGKTAQTLAVSALGGHQQTLIFCPKNVTDTWVTEIQKFTNTPLSQIFTGSGQDLTNLPPSLATNFRFFIFNYESAVVAYKTRDIYPCAFKMCSHVVLDECHAVKNSYTKKYMALYYFLYQNPPDQLTLLSGTPFDKYAGEQFAYLQLLGLSPHADNSEFHKNYFNPTVFDETFSEPRGGNSFYSYNKNQLPALAYLWGDRPIRRNIQDVTELPPLHNQEIALPPECFPGVDQDELIEKMQAAIRLMAKMADEGTLNGEELKVMGAIQKIRVEISKMKIRYTAEMAEKYLVKFGPPVVFFEFVESMHECAKILSQKGYPVEEIWGDISQFERSDKIERFQKENVTLLATLGTLAEGVNLQKSNAVIFNDIPWRPLSLQQAERRVWRIGQTRPCYKVALYCDADKIVVDNILRKSQYVEEMMKILSTVRERMRL